MKSKLRRICLFLVLAFGGFANPEKIAELLDTMNQTRIVLTIQGQNDEGKSKKSGP